MTSKKPWSFKFRKPSFNSGSAGMLKRRAVSNADPIDLGKANGNNSESKLEIVKKLFDTTVPVGITTQLKCHVYVPRYIGKYSKFHYSDCW